MIESPLLPVALAFALGIAAAPRFYLTAPEQLALLIFCASVAAVLASLRKFWPVLVIAWSGFFLCGTILAGFEHLPAPDSHIESLARTDQIQPTKALQAIGWVRVPTQPRPGVSVFELEIERIHQDEREFSTTGTIRVYYYPRNSEDSRFKLPYGTRVALKLRDLRAPKNYGNPAMFDYVAAMRREGISFTALLRSRERDLEILPGRAGSRGRAAIFRMRESMLAAIERLFPSKPKEQSILKAMLFGDDHWLSEGTEEAFQRSGTYHVLVISGWNVAVFAGPLLLILARFRFANWLSSLIVFLAVVSFALLAQSEIPIMRASCMFFVYLAALLFFRHRSLLNSLSAAALLLLTLNPLDLFDWGFQLSFMAVLTLATIAMPSSEWKIAPFRRALGDLSDPTHDVRSVPRAGQFRMDLRCLFRWMSAGLALREQRLPTAFNSMRVVTLLVLMIIEALFFASLMQMGYAWVTAQYFHRLTWSGILGNLLILPIASCIVLFGMALMPVEFLFPALAKWIAPPLGWLCLGLEGVASFSASLDSWNFRVATPPLWVSIGFLVSAVVVSFVVAQRSRWTSVAGLSLAVWCVLLSFPRTRETCQPGKLELAAVDVGQGDALFVCFPKGSTMLIDGGGAIPIPGSPVRRLDIGESVVSPYLWDRGVSKLDYVVLSHDHFDHMGGLPAVFDNFRVGEFWIGPDAADRRMDWLRQRAASAGARIVWPVSSSAGATAKMIDGVQIEVLSPPPEWAPRNVSNNDSIVLRLVYGNRSILLAGDIESRMEYALAAGDAALKSDVLKVAHHGSRTSTTPEFLSRVDPAIGVVSVGAYGRFGHPSQDVVKRLNGPGRMLYMTPTSGSIRVFTDGHSIQVETFSDNLNEWPPFFSGGSSQLHNAR